MLKRWKKLFKKVLRKPVQNSGKAEQDRARPISAKIDQNASYLNRVFDRCGDIIVRDFEAGTNPPVKALIVYVDGLVNKQLLTDDLLKSFMFQASKLDTNATMADAAAFARKAVPFTEVKVHDKMEDVLASVLAGETALLVEGFNKGFSLSTQNWPQRSVTEPETEALVRGPREGFIEGLQTNLTLIRRRLKTPDLKFENLKVGAQSQTAVSLGYLEGIVNPKIVEEARRRLNRIDIDGIMDSGYIEEYIEDAPWSIFPTVQATERPDKVAAGLLEGQVAILVDTSPFALLVPVTFPKMLQASEDYYLRWPFASFIRFIRFVTLNITLLAAPFYIAITTYHQEMLPTPLLISIAAAREGVPFPAFVEAILMETTFEVLREAGVRLPKPIGQAVSIVGALVIGQAAVEAGLVSPAMVIIVSLTAIASFSLPSYFAAFSLRLLRFPLMALAAALGLFGIMAGLLAILIHLCSIRSFGIPYISPLSPFSLRDFKDMLYRAPWWAMKTRPKLQSFREPQRQDPGQQPKPPVKQRKGGR